MIQPIQQTPCVNNTGVSPSVNMGVTPSMSMIQNRTPLRNMNVEIEVEDEYRRFEWEDMDNELDR